MRLRPRARGDPLLPEQQKKRKKMSYFAVGMETGKLIIGYRAQQITCCIGYESVTDSLWNR